LAANFHATPPLNVQMLLWITVIAVVWISLLVLVLAACRAAAQGDVFDTYAADRSARFSRVRGRTLPQRRTHA